MRVDFFFLFVVDCPIKKDPKEIFRVVFFVSVFVFVFFF